MMGESEKKISLTKALCYIIASLFVVAGGAVVGLSYMKNMLKQREHDPKFNIAAIAQKSSEAEALKTVYLAELLDLSIDRPSNLYRFDIKEAKEKLIGSALIKDAVIKKIKPRTIFIDYQLRKPIAFLGDYTNTAIDAEGYLIPFKPFFTPKNLPVIYLGDVSEEDEEKHGKWGGQIEGSRARLAMKLYRYLTFCCSTEKNQLKKIDVSRAFALSYGQRQIVVIMEDKVEKEEGVRLVSRILRLSTLNYRQELANYLVLRGKMFKDTDGYNPVVIDLRIPQLAFLAGS